MENTKGTKCFTRKPSANESMMYLMEMYNERTKSSKIDIDRVLNILNDGFNVLFDSEKFNVKYELLTCHKYNEGLVHFDSNFNSMLELKECIDKRIEENKVEFYFDDNSYSDANVTLCVSLFIGTIDLVSMFLTYDVWEDSFIIYLFNYLDGTFLFDTKLFNTKKSDDADDETLTGRCKSHLEYYINSALNWAKRQKKMEKERSLEIKEIKRISKKMN